MEFEVSERETLISWKTVIYALDNSGVKIYHYLKNKDKRVIDRSNFELISYENLRIVEYPDLVFKLKFFKEKKIKKKFKTLAKETKDKIILYTRAYIEKFKIKSSLSKNYLDTQKAIQKTKTGSQKEKLEIVCVTLLPLLFKEFDMRLKKMKGKIIETSDANKEYAEIYYGFKGLIHELNKKCTFIYNTIIEMEDGIVKQEKRRTVNYKIEGIGLGISSSLKDNSVSSFKSGFDLKFDDFSNEDEKSSFNRSSQRNLSQFNTEDKFESEVTLTNIKIDMLFEIEHFGIEVGSSKRISQSPIKVAQMNKWKVLIAENSYFNLNTNKTAKLMIIENNYFNINSDTFLKEMIIENNFLNINANKVLKQMAIETLSININVTKIPKEMSCQNNCFDIKAQTVLKQMTIENNCFYINANKVLKEMTFENNYFNKNDNKVLKQMNIENLQYEIITNKPKIELNFTNETFQIINTKASHELKIYIKDYENSLNMQKTQLMKVENETFDLLQIKNKTEFSMRNEHIEIIHTKPKLNLGLTTHKEEYQVINESKIPKTVMQFVVNSNAFSYLNSESITNINKDIEDEDIRIISQNKTEQIIYNKYNEEVNSKTNNDTRLPSINDIYAMNNTNNLNITYSNSLNKNIDFNYNTLSAITDSQLSTNKSETIRLSRSKFYSFQPRLSLAHHIYTPIDLINEYIKQLSTNTLRISIAKCEPITKTQKQCERMFNAQYLSNASRSNNKKIQLLFITTFILKELSLELNRLMQPIPSLKRETFEYCNNRLDYRFISEEVNTKPSITAFIGEATDFIIEGDTKSAFAYKPMQNIFETKYATETVITLLPSNEQFTYTLPNKHFRTKSYLNSFIEFNGIINLKSKSNKGNYAKIAIVSNEVNGRICINHKEQYQLIGSLMNTIKAIDSIEEKSEIIYTIPEEKYILNSLKKRHYYIPNESYNLNYADDDLKAILPKTDSRKRKDVRLYEKGKKIQVEEANSKTMIDNNSIPFTSSNSNSQSMTHQPKFFDYIKGEGYRYKGNYWNSYRHVHLS